MSVTVAVTDLSYAYRTDGPIVLREVSLEVPAGSLTTVLGPSGSGKSTLLALLAGVESPHTGDIRFDGESVLSASAQDRRVALVLQQPYLFPYLTVGENVAFGLAARGVARRARVAEADRWLSRVGLDGMAGRRPRELSGGEQQRVALVRALATNPRLLLLDEPLASLDPDVRSTLQAMLRSIVTETGVTTVMVTHDLTEAMSLGDRTAVLDGGGLVAEGPSEALFRRPPTRRAAQLVGVGTFIEGVATRGSLMTPAGTLAVDDLDRVDGTTTIAIRPEHVRLAPPGQPNTVRGRVVECTFRGEHWDVVVDTTVGRIRARSGHGVESGTACDVGLDPSHLFVVAEDSAAT